jgi:hypothetical protein
MISYSYSNSWSGRETNLKKQHQLELKRLQESERQRIEKLKSFYESEIQTALNFSKTPESSPATKRCGLYAIETTENPLRGRYLYSARKRKQVAYYLQKRYRKGFNTWGLSRETWPWKCPALMIFQGDFDSPQQPRRLTPYLIQKLKFPYFMLIYSPLDGQWTTHCHDEEQNKKFQRHFLGMEHMTWFRECQKIWCKIHTLDRAHLLTYIETHHLPITGSYSKKGKWSHRQVTKKKSLQQLQKEIITEEYHALLNPVQVI